MPSKYVLHCDHNDSVVNKFIDTVKHFNRDYTVLYNKQDDGDMIITFNELIFEDFNEFLDHLEATNGGYDGTFGYSK